jgi:hypothetical protein
MNSPNAYMTRLVYVEFYRSYGSLKRKTYLS